MRPWLKTRRVAVVTAALLVLTVSGVGAANALSSARSSNPGALAASTGTWGALPTTASGAPYTPGALTLTFLRNGNKAPAPQYFWLVSTGTLPLTAVTTTLTSTVAGKAETCSTGWVEATGTCAGTVATLDTTTAGGTSTPLSLAAGSRIRVKASLTVGLSGPTTMTVSLAVPRTGTRSGTTTTS
jgi:hypothetical protein